MHKTFRRFISAPELLEWYSSGLFYPCDRQFNKYTAYNDLYVMSRREQKHLPNYIHELQLHNDLDGKTFPFSAENVGRILMKSYEKITGHCLVEKHNRIYVKSSSQEEWQELITYFSTIPALSFMAFNVSDSWQEGWGMLEPLLAHSTIPPVLDPLMDLFSFNASPRAGISVDMGSTSNQGQGDAPKAGQLYELHVHLSGTSEADITWLRCLDKPLGAFNYLAESFEKEATKRFYRQFHFNKPEDIYHRLRLARWLQEAISQEVALKVTNNYPPPEEVSANSAIGLTMNGLNKIMALDKNSEFILDGFFGGIDPNNQFGWSQSARGATYTGNDNNLRHPLAISLKHRPDLVKSLTNVQLEGLMMLLAFKVIKEKHPLLPYLLHCYILLSSQMNQILVQQISQIGFDQFQHITEVGMREELEESYETRFQQLVGMYGPHLAHLEGRFAPKEDLGKISNLLTTIVEGYNKHTNQAKEAANTKNPQPIMGDLRLVAHFIKERDIENSKMCRHDLLRTKNYLRAMNIAEIINCTAPIPPHEDISPQDIRDIIVGKDAAANELDAPPEVFAPSFRILNKAGLSNTTYHVGEDFRHLLSGIRAVDEAVTFLDMRPGDRIGHGTALGIDPALWQERLGGSSAECWCYEGEWLDNLVWLCQVLKEENKRGLIGNLHMEMEEYYYKVYGRHGLSQVPHKTLHQAWEMRRHDPQKLSDKFVMEALNGQLGNQALQRVTTEQIKEMSFDIGRPDQDEITNLILAGHENPEALKLFKAYHKNMEVRSCYDQSCTIKVSCLFGDILKIAQDYMVKKLNEKKILVEVMPTSNKCISFYKDYSEHHLISWLKRGDNGSRPVPCITIASDDPGIFATSLRNEYSHVVSALIKYAGFSSDQAYSTINQLNNNAKAFAFRKEWTNKPKSIC